MGVHPALSAPPASPGLPVFALCLAQGSPGHVALPWSALQQHEGLGLSCQASCLAVSSPVFRKGTRCQLPCALGPVGAEGNCWLWGPVVPLASLRGGGEAWPCPGERCSDAVVGRGGADSLPLPWPRQGFAL